jgi:hypothetical protein
MWGRSYHYVWKLFDIPSILASYKFIYVFKYYQAAFLIVKNNSFFLVLIYPKLTLLANLLTFFLNIDVIIILELTS